ncbi:uncharacterized protein LOC111038676 [Myzus persicae]|uniref:uncharacterized protein LOC111038676 n=1 Tax=Myzus persicae TaxID=13164 RepID=UPI000B932F63|nr:uncharacterized protein LOC111038676 [Myzus persicae]
MDFMSTDFDLAENIFYFHNPETKSLAFVLNWDTKEKFYLNLLRKSYADVVDTPNDHSMVLTRPEKPNYFHKKIPAFDIKYIEDCFKIKDYPDPTKYLIKNTSLSNYTKDDILDCWLYQNKSWSDLVPIPKNKYDNWITANQRSSSNSISQVTSSNNNIVPSNHSMKIAPSSKNTRLPYTHKEEMNIVNYIVKNNHALDVKGKAMWQQMEHDNICKLRTWQSMKERYLKSIKYDLNSGNHRFPFLTPKDLKLLRQGLNIEQLSDNEKKAMKSRFNEERINNWSSSESS